MRNKSQRPRETGASKRARRGWKERKETFLPFLKPSFPSPTPPPLLFFGSRFISRAGKTENPFPRYFFAPKPNGNACYAG